MARVVARALPLASRSPPPPPPIAAAALGHRPLAASFPPHHKPLLPAFSLVAPRRRLHYSSLNSSPFGGFFASVRGFSRKVTKRVAAAKKKKAVKERELVLDVKICIEEELPEDTEILNIAEMLKLNVAMAMKVALDGLKDSDYKTRETSIDDVGKFEMIELSILLCNDDFIRKLNLDWRGEDHATDVLSMSQHTPGVNLPTLMLGDIVVSVETAARQADERGHTLLDEIRILLVHGLLHLLGFDHEISEEAEDEMEKEENLVLKSLGWKGKGLIKSAQDAVYDGSSQAEVSNGKVSATKKAGSLRFYKPKFRYIFCDMDGTLLNSKSQITATNADALREAISRGVNIVIATGKEILKWGSVLKTGSCGWLPVPFKLLNFSRPVVFCM